MQEIGLDMSVYRQLTVANTVTAIRIKFPNGRLHYEALYTTPQQEAIIPLVEFLASEARTLGQTIIKVRKIVRSF